MSFLYISVLAQKKETPKVNTLPFSSLAAYGLSVKANLPRANTEGFVKPLVSDRTTFGNAVAQLLSGNIASAEILANSVGYDLSQLNDTTDNKSYLVLSERILTFRGLGTYIVDPNYLRNIILEVPHPLFDTNTMEQGITMMKALSVRGLFISGTHRCANAEASTCSGTTTACTGSSEIAYKVSDVAHFAGNFFQEAHAASLTLAIKPLAISLHGNAASGLPDVTLGNGTEFKDTWNSPVNSLRRQMKNRSASVGSCNFVLDPKYSLCGSTNVQGRLSNGVLNACGTAAQSSSGLFLHIEQKINIRLNPQVLIDSLNALFPVVN
jgi:hypothetical protein